jgi:hypothetical protein
LNVNNGSYSYNAASTINLSSTQFGVSPSFFTKGPYNVTGSFKIDQSCSAAGGATATYTIDWGDSTAPSVRSVTLGACSASFSPSIADATMTHTYATNGTYTATLTVARTDVPGGTITKTKQIVADTEATSYIWRALQALLTGNTESLTANANGAASSFYVWASGK